MNKNKIFQAMDVTCNLGISVKAPMLVCKKVGK